MSYRFRSFCMGKRVNALNKFDVLLEPLVTEKSTLGAQYNQYSFKVRLDATKPAIRQSVEQIFGVQVTRVQTSILPGKRKRFRQTMGQRSDIKKAIVTLVAGQTIDFSGEI